MRKAEVKIHGVRAGILEEFEYQAAYRFTYETTYTGPPVSLTMPVFQQTY
jgi:HipA-like protein